MDEHISILSLMKQDHQIIESLIDSFINSIDGPNTDMRYHFEQLEWKLEKHLFIEEKAIFTFYEPEDVSQGFKMLPTLITQHNYILNELKNMRKEVNSGQAPQNIDELKSFLITHRNYEEKDVYPKLEEVLTTEQKKKIIDRISELR